MSLLLLHTADWHLGQVFHGFERDFEHQKALAALLALLEARKPEALVLSGDVYDSIHPSSVAQRRFFGFLAQARAVLPSLQILVTAGNHDAAARLEAPSALLESLGIAVVGTIPRLDDGRIDYPKLVKPLRGSTGEIEALVLAIPFLRPSDVPSAAPGEDAYLGGVKTLYREACDAALRLRDAQYPGAALLALGHCHYAGGEASRDSERRIVIGGAEVLGEDCFPPELAYVALGHLHKPQLFSDGRLAYSGSLLPLSFSEIGYKHRVLFVRFEQGRRTRLESAELPRSVPLLRIPAGSAATLTQVLAELHALEPEATLLAEAQPFLEVQVLDDGPDPTRRRQIEAALVGKPLRLASIKLVAPERDATDQAAQAPVLSLGDLGKLDPLELLEETHKDLFQTEPDAALRSALNEILAETAAKEGLA